MSATTATHKEGWHAPHITLGGCWFGVQWERFYPPGQPGELLKVNLAPIPGVVLQARRWTSY